jgi:hypothetical protein
MFSRITRWSPLFGIVFVVLVLIGGPLLQGSTPDNTASAAAVIAFYTAHQSRENAGVYFLAFAFIAFLYFAGTLRARWRGQPGCEALAAVVLAGAAIEVVGQCAGLSGIFALTADPARLSAGAAQALNLMANNLLVISAAGNFLFCVTAGVMMLRGRGIVPRWLGWMIIVVGIMYVLAPIEFIGFYLMLIWIVIVSVMLTGSRAAGGVQESPRMATVA